MVDEPIYYQFVLYTHILVITGGVDSESEDKLFVDFRGFFKHQSEYQVHFDLFTDFRDFSKC